MSKDALKLHVQALPSQPGVYQFYDSQERIIYVGKAKNLKIGCRPIFESKSIREKPKDWSKTSLESNISSYPPNPTR